MRLRSVCIVSLFSVASAAAQTASLDEIISAALKATDVPGLSVAVTQHGKTVYAKAFGRADIAANRAATADTRYAIGSISKEFTAAALLMMQEQGKLSLDDKVGKFFPQYTRANEVTVRELLSHTAGYEDYAPQDYIIPEWLEPATPETILERWAKKPLNFDPGTRWQYSNTNYVLAGEIFEKVSGRKLVDYLRETIFNPLGMTTASDCDEKRPMDAVAYTRYALGPPRPVKREAAGWYFAAGELCMVAADVARWDMGFMQKRLLSARSYGEFTREAKLANGSGTHYALGLDVSDLEGFAMVSHSGEVSGFLALNEMFPTEEISVTVLSNEDGVNLIFPLGRKIALAMLRPGAAGEAPPAELSQVRGIVEGLQAGRIDRALFTSNANSYFGEQALADYRDSLKPLGSLQKVSRSGEALRGGMTHRGYRLTFDKKAVTANVYLTADGKFEQFLIEGSD